MTVFITFKEMQFWNSHVPHMEAAAGSLLGHRMRPSWQQQSRQALLARPYHWNAQSQARSPVCTHAQRLGNVQSSQGSVTGTHPRISDAAMSVAVSNTPRLCVTEQHD